MSEEIALFIDFDNIRFSMLNIQRHEPDPQELIAVARRYGTIMVARAYADWSRQPETFKGSLTAAMIDRVDCPVKLRQRIRIGPAYEYGNPFSSGQNWSSNPPTETPLPRYSPTTGGNGPLVDNALQQDSQQDEQLPEKRDLLAEDLPYSADRVAQSRSFPMTTTAIQESDIDALEDPFIARRATDHLSAIPNGSGNVSSHSTTDLPSLGRHTTAHLPGINAGTSTLVQSTVDLNMVMDIIETVFDRPSISTFVLMTGDKDFTRICARLKLRLNKNVIIVGVPGTVSRDLISSASQFVPLVPPSVNTDTSPSLMAVDLASAGDIENISTRAMPAIGYSEASQLYEGSSDTASMPLVDALDPLFVQFLDYIDRNWPLRTTSSIAHFLGDPFNPKNRFRGRFTRESARELLHICIHEKILLVHTGATGIPELYLNRAHPDVAEILKHF